MKKVVLFDIFFVKSLKVSVHSKSIYITKNDRESCFFLVSKHIK